MSMPFAGLASSVAIVAAGAWLVLVLGLYAVAETPLELEALLRCASRVCVLGSVVLFLLTPVNIAVGLAGPFGEPSLLLTNLGGLLLANILMATAFFGERAAIRFWTRVRLWALLNLTFVLILAVVIAGGGQ